MLKHDAHNVESQVRFLTLQRTVGIVAVLQPSKLATRVQFPHSAPNFDELEKWKVGCKAVSPMQKRDR